MPCIFRRLKYLINNNLQNLVKKPYFVGFQSLAKIRRDSCFLHTAQSVRKAVLLTADSETNCYFCSSAAKNSG